MHVPNCCCWQRSNAAGANRNGGYLGGLSLLSRVRKAVTGNSSGASGTHPSAATAAPRIGSVPGRGTRDTGRSPSNLCHARTSHAAEQRLRCADRLTDEHDRSYPVKLVVFDLDETLTLVTYMCNEDDTDEAKMYLTKVNFETPWVDPGSRISRLKQLLSDIKKGSETELPRVLAVLTRNANKKGVTGVLELLQLAGLDVYFSALWTVPARPGQMNGVFRKSGSDKWTSFQPPVSRVPPHKADVLHHLAMNPAEWFPQLKTEGLDGDCAGLQDGLQDEGIVLVDDQRANFRSPATGRQILRYCKVARYDAQYRSIGFLKDMGGIGAHSADDYETLRRFVEDPWMCKENHQVRCLERNFDDSDERNPVSLVVFDFDETLTLATFMPVDPACSEQIGWTPADSKVAEWSTEDLLAYNFESPYVEGSRIQKLRQFFKELVVKGAGRTLAILTKNEAGVVGVLNLLKLAYLDQSFSAIWCIPGKEVMSTGVYKEASGEWKCFSPPMDKVEEKHKADVLQAVVHDPSAWFPQLCAGSKDPDHAKLLEMHLESVVLVDDERANFRSYSMSQARVLRYGKVARYDDTYRDCGFLNQMGGLGAHSDVDFELVKAFVKAPWDYPYEPTPVFARQISEEMEKPTLLRTGESSEDGPKAPRIRTGKTMDALPSLGRDLCDLANE